MRGGVPVCREVRGAGVPVCREVRGGVLSSAAPQVGAAVRRRCAAESSTEGGGQERREVLGHLEVVLK